ncbi:hypothetical protein [Celeribacter litoreus]|uniref:hypothetical protein n=1 Tax=Celeribacter litoreus TaxID=2876714 RepID=UPI001CCA3CFE|nr:hypothetical protein [Celeribacter litoreus]MCA0042281.1 hypothetical protein [Celeribacter litoreus]
MKRLSTLFVISAVLSACQMALPNEAGGIKTASLGGGVVDVMAPGGFCVDPASLRSGFVLMGHCSGLNGQHNPRLKGRTAVITLSLSDPLDQTAVFEADELSRVFSTVAGRAALSRSGRAETVTVLESSVKDDAVILHAVDRSAATQEGLDDTYWRGFFELEGRLATVTVTPFADTPMGDASAKRLLNDVISDLKARNPAAAL